MLLCTILSVLIVPVFAENETVSDSPVATDVPTAQPTGVPTTIEITTVETTVVPTDVPTVLPTEIPTTVQTTTVPTDVPTDLLTEIPTTVQTTTVPTQIQTTPMDTVEPDVIPTTAEVTVQPTDVPTTQPTITTPASTLLSDNSTEVQGQEGNGTVISSLVPAEIVPPIPAAVSNTTIELNQSAGNTEAGGYDLSWTANVTDPPLNTTNLQGTTPGSQYWEINGSTGTTGVTNYYPLDLGGLLTNSLVGIWIHDVSNVILDGMGNTLQYNGPANTGATGIVINWTSGESTPQNIQITNLTLLGWDTGISITDSNNVYISNTSITGNRGSGGNTGSGIVATDSTNVFIATDPSAGSVTALDNGQNGILFNNVTGGLINNTLVADNGAYGRDGISLISSHGITIQNVTAIGNGGSGFYLEQSTNNNLIGNTATGSQSGIYLYQSEMNNIRNNNLTGNSGQGIYLEGSSNNIVTGNTMRGGIDPFSYWTYGLLIHGYSDSNIISGNTITGNNASGIYIVYHCSDNVIYNNYFNNTFNVVGLTDVSSVNNTWNIAPTPGTNIVNGDYIGGNYWATPDGQGWSETHPDTGLGFTIPYNVTSYYNNVDHYPLVLPTPTPAPNPSGGGTIPLPSIVTPPLPFDSVFTGNDIPETLQSCHSYLVHLTVKNTGTMNWSRTSGVVLIPSSSNGFTFDPSRGSIPEGVVVHPGDSYTFPVIINVPCPMKDGTYQLRFRLAHPVQTKSGPVEITFGEVLADSVNVGTTTVALPGVKMGVKTISTPVTIPGSTTSFSARQFTTTTSGLATSSSPHLNRNQSSRFPLISTLFWAGILQEE